MTQIFQKPVLKAIPALTIFFIIGCSQLLKNGTIPAWLGIAIFVTLSVLNIGVIYSNYKQNPKSVLPKVLLGIFFIALALGIFLFQLNNTNAWW